MKGGEKHTPTPWQVDAERENVTFIDCIAVRESIAQVLNGDHGTLPHEANARFIVEACNSHASLLSHNKTLREALECATCLHIDEPGREGPDLHPLRKHGWDPSKETGPMFVARLARAALAQSKETV